MRPGPAVVVVVVLLVAGCGAPFGSSTPTVTPAPVPTAPEQSAPGVSAERGVSPDQLAGAHRDVLETTSFRLVRETTVTEDGRTIWHREHRARIDDRGRMASRTELRTAFLITHTAIRVREVWYNGTDTMTRNRTFGGQEHVTVESGPPNFDVTGYRYVRSVLRSTDPEPTGGDDVRLTSRTLERTDRRGIPPFLSEPHNATVTIVVRPDGVVRSMWLEYDALFFTLDNVVEVVDRFHVAGIGETTVERPDWVEGVEETDRVGGNATHGQNR